MRKQSTASVYLWTMVLLLAYGLSCERFEPELMLVIRTETAEENPGGGYIFTGAFINIGGEEITQHGFCWSESANPTIRDKVLQLGTRQQAGTFTGSIRELAPGTQYYYRAYATTQESTFYGTQKILNTPVADLPEVVTLPFSDVDLNSVVFEGEVISDGGGNILVRGVCWNTEPGPTVHHFITEDGAGTGTFSSVLEGLFCSTTYYVRAYAINESGIAYGEEQPFTTLDCIPAQGEFLLSDRGGAWIMNQEGEKIWFSSKASPDIDVFNNLIFLHDGNRISVYTWEGDLVRIVEIDSQITNPYVMCVLPGEEFAFLDNSDDVVSITDTDGNLKETISITGNPADGNLQSIEAVVVENMLIVSEDGSGHLIGIDLDTYERGVFKDLEQLTGWLGDIDFSDGLFYLVQSRKVHRFTREGEVETLCELPEGNNTGIAVHKDFAYVTSNFGNKIYRINIRNGEYSVLLDNVDYPKDIELLR